MGIKKISALIFSFATVVYYMGCSDYLSDNKSIVEPKEADVLDSYEKEKDKIDEICKDEELIPPVAEPPLVAPPYPELGQPFLAPILGGGGGGRRDLCPRDAKKAEPGVCGCGVPDIDADQDNVFDCVDNCPDLANPEQEDVDEDGVGALCDCDDENDQIDGITGQARYVDPSGSDTSNDCLEPDFPCLTIVYAIGQSNEGDTLVLANGSFFEDTILVDKNLMLLGQGPTNTIVDAEQNGRVFLIAEDVEATICGITITGGLVEGMGDDTNLSPGAGAGIFNDGTLLLSNSLVTENSANLAGAGIWNNTDSVMHIRNSTISLNISGQSVGGFGNYYLSTMTIDNTSIINNTAGFVGGGGGSAGDSFSISNSLVSGNTSSFLAGGIILVHGLVAVGSVQIENTEFSQNSSALGGAIIANGVGTTIENSRFLDNTATQDGGAIALVGQEVLQITDSTFSDNDAALSGGAIQIIEDSRLFLLRSTINDNSATLGGGIAVSDSSEVFVTDSTISTNTATSSGGGIYETGLSSLSLNLSTIAFNTAINGGGVFKTSNSNLDTYHTIISDNISNDCEVDIGTVINNANFSLFSDASCTFSSGSDNLASTDPLLGPLQDNGGLTETHALLGLSPAIDSGNTNCTINFDQRGEFRPVNIIGLDPIDAQARCDIGSFEVQQP